MEIRSHQLRLTLSPHRSGQPQQECRERNVDPIASRNSHRKYFLRPCAHTISKRSTAYTKSTEPRMCGKSKCFTSLVRDLFTFVLQLRRAPIRALILEQFSARNLTHFTGEDTSWIDAGKGKPAKNNSCLQHPPASDKR